MARAELNIKVLNEFYIVVVVARMQFALFTPVSINHKGSARKKEKKTNKTKETYHNA